MNRFLFAAAVIGLLGLSAGAPAAAPGEDGWALLRGGKIDAAIRVFREHNESQGGRCADCLLGLAAAYNRKGDHKASIRAAREVLTLTEDPAVLSQAYNFLGVGLFAGGKAKGKSLAEAERSFRAVLELTPEAANVARVNLAEVLWARVAEAPHRAEPVAEIRRLLLDYLAREPEGPLARPARRMLCGSEACTPLPAVADTRKLDQGEIPWIQPFGSAGSSQGEDIAEITEEVQPPRKVFTPHPRYTQAARKARHQGTVVLQAVIDEAGKVIEVEPLQGLLFGLTEATVETVRSWRFEPASRQGKPLKVWYRATVSFSLSRG